MIARNILAHVGAVAMVLSIVATGCSRSSSTGDGSTQSEAPPASSGVPSVEQAREAGAIARAIESEPNRMSEILSEHGMTAESLENLMFEIARDPKLSEAYEAAKESPSSG